MSHGVGATLDNKHAIARRIARFFHPGDVLNLGIGAPLLVGHYTGPDILIHTENGCIGVGTQISRTDEDIDPKTQLESFANAGGMPFLPNPGAMVFSSEMSYAIIRGGKLTATVLGCYEVSENGDLANWFRPGGFAGMGGAMDLCRASMVVVATEHCTKKGEPKLIPTCTLPLTAKGRVTHVVTERAVFEFQNKKMVLTEIREGYDLENIQANTTANFEISPNLKTNVEY